MDDNSIKTRLRVHVACRERQHQEQQKQHKQQQERKQNRKRKREESRMTDRCKETKGKSTKCEEQSLSASRVVKLRKTALVHHRKRKQTRIPSSKLSNKRTVGITVKCVCSETKTRELRKAGDRACGKACKAQTRKEKQSSQKQTTEGKPNAQQSSQIIPSAAPLMPTHFQLLAHFPVPKACKPAFLNMVCLVDSRWALLSSEISDERGEYPPSFRLHKYEVPGGRLVWSTPLPPGVTERCWKFCLPSEMVAEEDGHGGEIVLWQWDWTYLLDCKGQLLRSFKTVSMPDGVVSSGVVYNEQIGKTKKTQIVVRSLQDHSEVMTLGMGVRFTHINVCQEFETRRIATLSDRLTVTVFSSAGEQLTSWKIPYTSHQCKAMVWFNSSVLCVRQWPGRDLHFHAWDTGRELALFRTTEQLAMDNKDDLWEVDIRGDMANMIVYNFDTRLLRLATYRLQY